MFCTGSITLCTVLFRVDLVLSLQFCVELLPNKTAYTAKQHWPATHEQYFWDFSWCSKHCVYDPFIKWLTTDCVFETLGLLFSISLSLSLCIYVANILTGRWLAFWKTQKLYWYKKWTTNPPFCFLQAQPAHTDTCEDRRMRRLPHFFFLQAQHAHTSRPRSMPLW